MVGVSSRNRKNFSRMPTLLAMLVVCSSLVVQSSGATTIRRELIGNATEISLIMAAMAGADSGESSIAPQPASSALSVDTLDTAVPTSASEVSDATSPATASLESIASVPLESEADLADSTASTTTPDLIVKPATSIAATSTSSDLDASASASSSSSSGSGALSTTPSKLTSTAKTTSVTKKTSIVSSSGSESSGSESSGSTSGSSTKKKSSTNASTSSGSSDNGKYTGSGSTLTYACECKDVRKVSLMGQSDYCLAPDAIVENKCGNVAVGENGECPRIGAQPCSVTGHTLANDSLCLFDDSDSVYKCVASAEDLEIKKNGGKKKKKKSNSTASQAPNTISSDAGSRPHAVSSFQVVTLIASIALGIATLA
uniref:Uncharacterized protein n=1 Tax=Globisporangium ultimum (strain ATCC 200006 / CBS 805.95 / DAOM BR144) TaxID=431595 RepID=K3WXA8_GLOUD